VAGGGIRQKPEKRRKAGTAKRRRLLIRVAGTHSFKGNPGEKAGRYRA
jgi:hypothetical protein